MCVCVCVCVCGCCLCLKFEIFFSFFNIEIRNFVGEKEKQKKEMKNK